MTLAPEPVSLNFTRDPVVHEAAVHPLKTPSTHGFLSYTSLPALQCLVSGATLASVVLMLNACST